MANSHCAVKNGATGKAAGHAAYICGTGKYAEKGKEEVIYIEHGNMPSFAKDNPIDFWNASDEFGQASYTSTRARKKDGAEIVEGVRVQYKAGEKYEQKFNGRAFKENEGSVPRELAERKEQVAFVKRLAEQIVGKNHPYTFAVHAGKAKDGLPNVNYHIMFSERKIDWIDRDRELFFKRPATAYKHRTTKQMMPADPAKGGAAKDRDMNTREFVQKVRAIYQNTAAEFGIERDMRSNKARGLDAAEPKIGPIHRRTGELKLQTLKLAAVESIREVRFIKRERQAENERAIFGRVAKNLNAASRSSAATNRSHAFTIADFASIGEKHRAIAAANRSIEQAINATKHNATTRAIVEAAGAAVARAIPQIARAATQIEQEKARELAAAKILVAQAEADAARAAQAVREQAEARTAQAQALVDKAAAQAVREQADARAAQAQALVDKAAAQAVREQAEARTAQAQALVDKAAAQAVREQQAQAVEVEMPLIDRLKASFDKFVKWISGSSGECVEVNTHRSEHFGPVVQRDDLHCVQKTGKKDFAIHILSNLDKLPALDDPKMEIKYLDGVGRVVGKLGQEVER